MNQKEIKNKNDVQEKIHDHYNARPDLLM